MYNYLNNIWLLYSSYYQVPLTYPITVTVKDNFLVVIKHIKFINIGSNQLWYRESASLCSYNLTTIPAKKPPLWKAHVSLVNAHLPLFQEDLTSQAVHSFKPLTSKMPQLQNSS